MDSFAQLNNTFTIELFDGLLKYRKRNGKLSSEKLNKLFKKYKWYQDTYDINENKIVHISKEELEELNS